VGEAAVSVHVTPLSCNSFTTDCNAAGSANRTATRELPPDEDEDEDGPVVTRMMTLFITSMRAMAVFGISAIKLKASSSRTMRPPLPDTSKTHGLLHVIHEPSLSTENWHAIDR
jgi:hypothetical protein